jgi:hypothetical protein
MITPLENQKPFRTSAKRREPHWLQKFPIRLRNTIAILILAASLTPCSAARIPEYTIILQLEPINCDIPNEIAGGLEYRLPKTETGADNSNYKFRAMRPGFRLQSQRGDAYEYRATINQKTGINYSTLWTLHFAKKRRAVEIRFNHPDYDIRSYAGQTFLVEPSAFSTRSPVLKLQGTISLREGLPVFRSGNRTRVDVALDSATIGQADLTTGPVEVQLSDGRPVIQVLPDGSARTAKFSNLAELGSGAALAPPASARMFRLRIGKSATQIMATMNPAKPGERLLLLRYQDLSSLVPPRRTAPLVSTPGRAITMTNFVTIPRTNLVTLTVTKTNLVNVPQTNLVTVTQTVMRTNVVNIPKTNLVTLTVIRTNLVKVTQPVGLTAVFALMPQNAPGVVPPNFELGVSSGSGTPASLGFFDSKGSLTTAALPKVNGQLPLFVRPKGAADWARLPETVNPSGKSPLNVINAMTLVPGEPVQFNVLISANAAAPPDAHKGMVRVLAGGQPTGIEGPAILSRESNSERSRWTAAVSGALSRTRYNQRLTLDVDVPGFRQSLVFDMANLTSLNDLLGANNNTLPAQIRKKVTPDQRGLAIIIDPARRWSNFTVLRNRITDELFNRIDARNQLKAPLIVGADRGPYDTVKPDDFKDKNFDLYSFFFNGFRDQSVRGGMMTPKGAAEIIGALEDKLALAQHLEIHGGWNIVCVMPHNPGGETAGAVPDRETTQNLIASLQLADASLLVIENGSTSRYLTALQDRIERMTGDKNLFRYQSRKEVDKVMELINGEIDKLVPAAPAR